MNKKKPILFLILKILAGVFLCVAITGIVFIVTGFGDFESNKFMLGGIMTGFGFFLTATCAGIGFMPEMSKFSVKTTKYIQQVNKDDMADIASTNAEIHSDAVKTMANAVKEGFENADSPTVYCKHCGEKIDADSRFCKACGKEQ